MKKLFLLFLLFCCHYSFAQKEGFIPINLNDGWVIDSVNQDIGLNSLYNSLENKVYKKIDGILIVKNGKLIFEKYYNGYSDFLLHDTRSATKSITSLMVGKAIDLKHLKSEEELLSKYFPEYRLNSKNVKIKDLLMMRSGLDCNDWNMESEGNEQKMASSNDWYKHIIELEKLSEAGEEFSYCTGGYNLLGRVLEKSSQTSIEMFTRKQIFEPMKISDYNWYTNTHNFKPYMGGGLFLNLRDFAKFGQLILDEGKWAGNQIVSKLWIEKILNNGKEISVEKDNPRYSYGWWQEEVEDDGKKYDLIVASGNGGQKLMIVKELGLVVALFGNGYGDPFFEGKQPMKILKSHLVGMK